MGAAVTEFAPGDCVFGYARLDTVEHGTVAEKVVLPVRVLAKAPTSIELERGGRPTTGLTAFQLTRRLDIQPGEIVLIQRLRRSWAVRRSAGQTRWRNCYWHGIRAES